MAAGRRCWPLVLAALLVASVACGSRYGLKPPISRDTIEKAPVGLDIEVSSFSWAYQSGGYLFIKGQALNNSGRAHSDLNLFAMLFDEDGRGVALGEARLSPSTLEPGQTAAFQLKAAASRPRGIKYLRLLTHIKSGL